MAKVICTIENASELISDVRFVKHKDGMISEEIDDEKAKFFLSCTGFYAAGAAPKGKRGRPPKASTETAPVGQPPVTSDGDDSSDDEFDANAGSGDEVGATTGDDELDGDGNPLF